MTEPVIQPPEQKTFPWHWLIGGVAGLLLLAAAHFWQNEIADVARNHAPAAIVRPSPAQAVEKQVEELKSLMATYRKMSMELPGKTGEARANALDDRTLVVGRINALIDIIPASKLPPEAHRFTAGR